LTTAFGADDFDESHPDMFVFVEKDKSLQKYGYSGFCKRLGSMTCGTLNKLPYRKYLGKRGYFVSMDILKSDIGWEFRQVLLETGETLYFVEKPYKGNILGVANGDIAFVKDIAQARGEEGKPIVDGSPVTIIRSSTNYGMTSFYVNDGEPFSADKLKVVRKLLNTLGTREFDEELVGILQVSKIDWDRIEGRFVIGVAPFFYDDGAGPVRARVVKAGGSISIVETIRYDSGDWLFANRYIIVAGDERYESPSIDFKRDHSGGKVWEWTSSVVDDERLGLLKTIAEEDDSIVRFHGSDYYADKELSAKQREGLRMMLRLHELLSSST